jgi:hypothetical protein
MIWSYSICLCDAPCPVIRDGSALPWVAQAVVHRLGKGKTSYNGPKYGRKYAYDFNEHSPIYKI